VRIAASGEEMKRVLMVLIAYDKHIIEIQNSILAITVGLVFIVNYLLVNDIYDRLADRYQYMDWLPGIVWGIVFLSTGIAHLLSIYTNWRYIRKQILLIKSSLWVFFAVSILSADHYAFSGYFYIIFAVVAFKSFLRIKLLPPDLTPNYATVNVC
jgi:MFS family permease